MVHTLFLNWARNFRSKLRKSVHLYSIFPLYSTLNEAFDSSQSSPAICRIRPENQGFTGLKKTWAWHWKHASIQKEIELCGPL